MLFVDGTAVQANRKTAAAERGLCRQGTVRSRGGPLGRVVGVADALGYLVRFMILHGLQGARPCEGAGPACGCPVLGAGRGKPSGPDRLEWVLTMR